MFNAEGQKIGVSGSVHGGNQHLSDLFLLTLLTFNEVIPVVPSSSGLELKKKCHFQIRNFLNNMAHFDKVTRFSLYFFLESAWLAVSYLWTNFYLKEDIIAAHGIRHWNLKFAYRLGDWAAVNFSTQKFLVETVKLLSAVIVHHSSNGPWNGKQHGTLKK